MGVNVSQKFSADSAGSTAETASFTIGGANRVLLVSVMGMAGTPAAPTAVKWGGSGGTAMTKIRDVTVGTFSKYTLWQLNSPTAQSSTVHVTWAGSQDARGIIAVSLEDVDSATLSVNGTTGTSNAPSYTKAANVVSGDLCIDFLSIFYNSNEPTTAITCNASQTSLQEIEGSSMGPSQSVWMGMGSSSKTASSTSVTMDWTISLTAKPWALDIVNITPLAGSTLSPGVGAITLNGNTPTTSAFQNVRIREVLVNNSGQAIGSAANITLLVWYSGTFGGAPDVSLNGMTTDAAGTTSWSIATGSLAFNQKIAYVAQDSISFSNYTAARMTPSYE